MKENLSDVLTRDQKLNIALFCQDANNAQTRLENLILGIADQLDELDEDSPEYEALEQVKGFLEDITDQMSGIDSALLVELCPEMEDVIFDVHGNVIDADGKIIETRNRKIDGDIWTKEQ